MPLVIIGVLLLLAKVANFGPTADWAWWWVLSPFAAAAVWWAVADATGITQRKAMEQEDLRAAKRREAQFESLGMRPPSAGRPAKPERPNRADN